MKERTGAGAVRWTRNGLSVPVAQVPSVPPADFRDLCVGLGESGARLAALCALPADERKIGGGEGGRVPDGGAEILAVLADDATGRLGLLRGTIGPDRSYPSLSADLPQAQAFERALFEEHGIRPDGHPWLKPLRRHETSYPFFRVEGPGIHEVAVGPVHAGIIEPGHFRFQCHGETVRHLEIRLGYQHRGAEALLLRSSPARRLVIAESIAGDTAIGHALAHCAVMEALGGVEIPLYAHSVRGVALELERLANHAGDLGALCNDIGYLPGASWFGRLRGEFLNLLMEISGNRFGRGLLKPGGVRFGIASRDREAFLARLAAAERDARDIADLTFDTPTVGSRFDEAGVVTRETAEALGLVGPVARASGCDRDTRRDHPFGIFRFSHIPAAVMRSGDVMARARVRWLEFQRSIAFIQEQLRELPEEALALEAPAPPPERLAVAIVEGWRGEIVHLAVTSAEGRLSAYRIVDPSFHNWAGLAMAMRGGQISDFPLCNKSFNLSYAGHDL